VLAQGAMIDLMNAIAKDAGFRVQFVMVPASEQIAALGSNKIDLALMVRIEKGTAAEFTDPLYKDSEALLVKKNDPKRYVTWEDLKGLQPHARDEYRRRQAAAGRDAGLRPRLATKSARADDLRTPTEARWARFSKFRSVDLLNLHPHHRARKLATNPALFYTAWTRCRHAVEIS
jgi:hypothetical protein